MNRQHKAQFAELARQQAPREACALLVQTESGETILMPARNIAPGDEHFALDTHSWLEAEEQGEVVGIVHSHPVTPATPSEHDRVACQATGLPWWVYSVAHDSWGYCEPQGLTRPLVGREWVHATSDCYTLIRDYYRLEMGIDIPDYERESDWWDRGGNLYEQNFADAGFSVISTQDLRAGDVMLFKVAARVTNHGGIYLGDGVMLHHAIGELSRREPIGEQYLRRITHALRYNRPI